MPRATFAPLALKACIWTKLILVELPVFATLIADTGAHAGDAVREGVCSLDRDAVADAESDGALPRESEAEREALTVVEGNTLRVRDVEPVTEREREEDRDALADTLLEAAVEALGDEDICGGGQIARTS